VETPDEPGNRRPGSVWRPLGKWTAGIVAGLVVAVAGYGLVELIFGDDEPRSRGAIDMPQRTDAVRAGDVAIGRISDIRDDRHVWLVARRGDVFWPIGGELRHEPSWERRIPGHLPRGKRLSLVLLTVGDHGNDLLRSEANHRRPLPSAELGELDELDVVSTFFVRVEARGPPLHAVFPQARRSGGQMFRYENAGGVVSAEFPDDPGCHRPDRPAGMRLEWRMSGRQSGGWDGSKAGRFDGSRFSRLALTVKGAAGGEIFEIGVKDTADGENRVPSEEVGEVSSEEWRELTVPLDPYENVDLKSLENVSVGFSQRHGSGTICIDEIVFERSNGAPAAP
jgi:hypothetical protein